MFNLCLWKLENFGTTKSTEFRTQDITNAILTSDDGLTKKRKRTLIECEDLSLLDNAPNLGVHFSYLLQTGNYKMARLNEAKAKVY